MKSFEVQQKREKSTRNHEEIAMNDNLAFRREVQMHLDRYYEEYPDVDLAMRANKALRFLASAEGSFKGEPAGWAAGIVYAIGSRPGLGMPGVYNHDLKRIFAVSPSVRNRANAVREELDVFPSYRRWT